MSSIAGSRGSSSFDFSRNSRLLPLTVVTVYPLTSSVQDSLPSVSPAPDTLVLCENGSSFWGRRVSLWLALHLQPLVVPVCGSELPSLAESGMPSAVYERLETTGTLISQA